ncbi:MAG: ferrochelatase [Methanobacteriota archaeon]
MIGVLLEAFGFLSSLDEVPAYLSSIRGREPEPREVAELRHRYGSIGGPGPLREHTLQQADALQAALGGGFRVTLGLRNSAPRLPEAAKGLAESGVDGIVCVALAPQYSKMSVERYHELAREGLARAARSVPARFVRSYATDPALVGYWADAVRAAQATLPDRGRDAVVLFTVHGLPKRILEWKDPYPSECEATATAVARAAGVSRHRLSYQSGHAGWLEPDVDDALEAIAKEGVAGVVFAPVGFVAEHLETLYDLDLEATPRARDLGLSVARARAPGADPRFIEALVGAVKKGF